MSLITHRPYVLEQDTTSIEELILASRTGKTLERYPTIWRVRQLLASRVWEPERDAHVWEDASGRCIGFAYLWRRIWLVRLIITCQNQTFLQVMLYNCSLEKKILLHIKHSLALHLLVWNIACSSLKVQNINIWSLLLLTIHSSLILNALSGKKNGNRPDVAVVGSIISARATSTSTRVLVTLFSFPVWLTYNSGEPTLLCSSPQALIQLLIASLKLEVFR